MEIFDNFYDGFICGMTAGGLFSLGCCYFFTSLKGSANSRLSAVIKLMETKLVKINTDLFPYEDQVTLRLGGAETIIPETERRVTLCILKIATGKSDE